MLREKRKLFTQLFSVVCIGAFLALSSGCLVNTYTVVKERPDQKMSGNQGYLMGGGSQMKDEQKRERKTYVMEVDFGKKTEADASAAYAAESIVEEEYSEPKTDSGYYYEETSSYRERPVYVAPQGDMDSYVVKKGDTLEKIAARPEIYNNKRKWYQIYKANEDVLKDPNKIKPGQALRIPR